MSRENEEKHYIESSLILDMLRRLSAEVSHMHTEINRLRITLDNHSHFESRWQDLMSPRLGDMSSLIANIDTDRDYTPQTQGVNQTVTGWDGNGNI